MSDGHPASRMGGRGPQGIEAQDEHRRPASLGSPADTLTLVRELVRLVPDRQIARLLNRAVSRRRVKAAAQSSM
ncbi:hypothetical protein MESS4_60085 [Mesorhizobium sp. STM 4661]|nr:hypothetical protein MESS4_60085 [Mesorhizobium sp. STM 4661]